MVLIFIFSLSFLKLESSRRKQSCSQRPCCPKCSCWPWQPNQSVRLWVDETNLWRCEQLSEVQKTSCKMDGPRSTLSRPLHHQKWCVSIKEIPLFKTHFDKLLLRKPQSASLKVVISEFISNWSRISVVIVADFVLVNIISTRGYIVCI